MTFLTLAYAATLCAAPAVHDGDTIRCGAERIRITNIDAPELPGSERCSPARVRQLARSRNPAWCDYQRGMQARDALRAFFARGPMTIHRQGIDHYGRTLATLTVQGRDAGRYLVGLGLARGWR